MFGDKTKYPRASDFDSSQDFFDHVLKSREACSERGYHRVDDDSKEPLICYDCDLWFGKEDGIEYRVEDPFKQ